MQDSIDKQAGTSTPAGFAPERHEPSVLAKTAGSKQRWQRAAETLAGGVSSGLRRTARPYPLFYDRGAGPRLTDVDGNTYLDYTLAWGPNILGNAPREVTEAIAEAIRSGLTFGAQHHLEYEVAEALTAVIPCADRVCYASSGTEIVQVALRLARAATGRTKVLKFEGHYHGWDDSILVSYHPSRSQVDDANTPIADGLGQLAPRHVVVAQWNSKHDVEAAFAANPGEISAILCEPLLCNSGCIVPQPGFLEFLREIATREGALLIFDEVITGFRLSLAGAQGFYGITPDLATYAKAVGAGAPLSVLAGKKQYMDLIGTGKVVHAGTLNGNPMVLAAAKASLAVLSANNGELYAGLHRRGQTLRYGLHEILTSHGYSVVTTGEGPVFGLHFMDASPRNYRDLLNANTRLYSDFALALLDEGVLALPDGRWYLSMAHTDADIEETLAAVRRVVG